MLKGRMKKRLVAKSTKTTCLNFWVKLASIRPKYSHFYMGIKARSCYFAQDKPHEENMHSAAVGTVARHRVKNMDHI